MVIILRVSVARSSRSGEPPLTRQRATINCLVCCLMCSVNSVKRVLLVSVGMMMRCFCWDLLLINCGFVLFACRRGPSETAAAASSEPFN